MRHRRPASRKNNGEACPPPDLAFDRERASHRPCKLVDDRQVQAGSAISAGRRVALVGESLEDRGQPVGMNAAVEIIGGRAEGALLVPIEALRELGLLNDILLTQEGLIIYPAYLDKLDNAVELKANDG